MSIRDEFVLVKEAAELLGVCPNTIRSWGESGRLKAEEARSGLKELGLNDDVRLA